MNIGLIAHDAKKILMQNFCIVVTEVFLHTNYSATEQLDD